MREYHPAPEHYITEAQDQTLRGLCDRYEVIYQPDHYHPILALPPDHVAGWVGGVAQQWVRRTIYIGVSPDGDIIR